MIQLFDEKIEKGTKFIRDLPLCDAMGNSTLLPYYVICGEEEGATICITSGVHGTEYPGIAANLQLYNSIAPKDLKGTIIGCPMCNFEAFVQKSMFVNPLDKKNLNNVFPGNPGGTITEVIAHVLLSQFVICADYHIDMHSGDSIEHLYPYAFYHKNSDGKIEVDEQARKMAEAYALDYIAITELDGSGASDRGNFYSSVSEFGIPCIQPEIGGIGLVEEKTKQLHYQGALNVLNLLGFLTSTNTTSNSNQVTLSNFYRLHSSHNGVFNSFVYPGKRIKKGDVLANITDYHGQAELEVFTASDDGVVLWIMSTLATIQKDTLMAIGIL